MGVGGERQVEGEGEGEGEWKGCEVVELSGADVAEVQSLAAAAQRMVAG